MTVDLGGLLEVALPVLAQVAPLVYLVTRESSAWRGELASWRRELSGARVTIEPAAAPAPATAREDEPTDEAHPLARPPVDVLEAYGPGVVVRRPARR